jgi:hypothetical protein
VNEIEVVPGGTILECSWQHYLKSPKMGNSINDNKQVNIYNINYVCTQPNAINEKERTTDISNTMNELYK